MLVLLRDPVERYISGVALQSETRRSGAASASAAFRLGLYGSQLEHLFRSFPPEQVLVLQFERCVKDPATELRAHLRVPRPRRGVRHRPISRRPRNAARVAKPTIDDDHRRWLVQCYEPEVAQVAELAPTLDLALWSNFAHLA